MPQNSIPDFDAKKIYLVSGKTLNAIKSAIQSDRPDVVTGGILEVTSKTEDGTYISAKVKTVQLAACVNGVAQTFNFIVQA